MDAEQQAQRERLDAEIREIEVLSSLPENHNKVYVLRVAAKNNDTVIAAYRNGVLLGVGIKQRSRGPVA
jgi:hypothetical protein